MAKKTYRVSVDFYSMEMRVSAKNKAEARKIAKERVARKIRSHINHLWIDND